MNGERDELPVQRGKTRRTSCADREEEKDFLYREARAAVGNSTSIRPSEQSGEDGPGGRVGVCLGSNTPEAGMLVCSLEYVDL